MAKRSTPSHPKAMPMDDYQAKDGFRTLVSAEEIKRDKGRLMAAQKHAHMHKAAISTITRTKPKVK